MRKQLLKKARPSGKPSTILDSQEWTLFVTGFCVLWFLICFSAHCVRKNGNWNILCLITKTSLNNLLIDNGITLVIVECVLVTIQSEWQLGISLLGLSQIH